MRRIFFTFLFFALVLPTPAYDEKEILNSPDLTEIDFARGEAADLQILRENLEARLAVLRAEYRYASERKLSVSEAEAIKNSPLDDGSSVMITKSSKRTRSRVVYWVSEDERRIYFFSDQDFIKGRDPKEDIETALEVKMEELEIASDSRQMFYEVLPMLEEKFASFGPIQPEMLGIIKVRTFEVGRKNKAEDLYIKNVTMNIVSVKYEANGTRVIVGEEKIRYDYPERVEICDRYDRLLEPPKYKTMTERNYQSVEAAANRKLQAVLNWSHGYTIDGDASLKAYGPGREEYVIIYFPQYLSYVLLYGNKAEPIDPLAQGGVYLMH